MIRLRISFLIALCILSFPLFSQINRPIGINIAAVSDYSTELVFTNAFRQARMWISYNADNTGPWDTDLDIPLREDGYPLEIPYNDGVNPPQAVKTVLTWDLFEGTPTGVFRLKSSGTGQIRLSHGHYGTFNSPIDTLITVNNNTGSGGVIFEIRSSLASDPIRDVQFILPGYVDTYTTQKYTSVFLDFLSDFQVIRFMDFTRTNGSSVVSWSDRTTANHYTQSKQTGAAWENVVEIANLTQKDIWINIPHQANDAYVDSLAHFLQSHLNPSSKIYLEYSNEVWNSIFSQNAYSAQMAQNLGYTGFPWERAWKYTMKRSADIFHIFDTVFAQDERVVKILPVQAANSWLTNQFVNFFNDPLYNPNQVTADAIAIAPYFGHDVANNIVSGNMVDSITVEQIIDSLDASLEEAMLWMTNNLAVANTHNLDLICYEGGQHLVATGNNMNIDVLTNKLKATNHHEGMTGLYCDYFNYWYEQAGGLFCHFSSTGRYSKYGSWGVKEFEHDTLNPKYIGLQNCVFAYNTVEPCTLSGCMDASACNFSGEADCDDGSCTYPGCTDPSALNYNPQAGCQDFSCYYPGTPGCLDPFACNYNAAATYDDFSCLYPGCLDGGACNYNSSAGCDDGSCIYPGCTEFGACNYDANAGCSNGSCQYPGCLDPIADNYNPSAGCSDGSCSYSGVSGCTDPNACNYNAQANYEDFTCVYPGCLDGSACNYNPSAGCDDGSCTHPGCTVVTALNYNPQAGCDDGSCIFLEGCMDPLACNYNLQADQEDGSCTYPGCTQPDACNYEPNAGCDDGSCLTAGCTDPTACNYSTQASCDDNSCTYLEGAISGPQLVFVSDESEYTYPCDAGCDYVWTVSDFIGTDTLAGVVTGSNNLCDVSVVWETYTGTANLQLEVTCDNGCSSTYVYPVQVDTGLEEFTGSTILLYPNPTSDYATLSISSTWLGATLHVRGLLGNLINSTTLTQLQLDIDTSAWSAGIYAVELERDGVRVNRMLVKE